MKNKNNNTLCQKVLSGNPEAFEQFVNMHTKHLLHYCYSRLSCYHDAQEVTQNSFYKFFSNIQSIKNNCKSYLYTIAKNCCFDEIKRKQRMKNISTFQNTDETETSIEEMFDQINPGSSPPIETIISFKRYILIIKSIMEDSFDEIHSPEIEKAKETIRQKKLIKTEERLLIKFVLLEQKTISEAGRLIGLNETQAHNKFKKILKILRKIIPQDLWIKNF